MNDTILVFESQPKNHKRLKTNKTYLKLIFRYFFIINKNKLLNEL
jgi:hypothetical protein